MDIWNFSAYQMSITLKLWETAYATVSLSLICALGENGLQAMGMVTTYGAGVGGVSVGAASGLAPANTMRRSPVSPTWNMSVTLMLLS
jgi:hypothetical protein